MRIGHFLTAIVLLQPPLTSRAADQPPLMYDVPRLDGITVDADAADWKDQGLRVDVLAPLDGQIVPTADFDMTMRLGWNDKGLLALIFVADDVMREVVPPQKPVGGDSVELFVIGNQGIIEYDIAPTDGRNKPSFRSWVVDGRPSGAMPKPALRAACRRTASGYVIEALLPFGVLRSGGTVDGTVGFQIIISDSDRPGQQKKHAWFPAADTLTEPGHSYSLRLGNATSPPVTAAAVGVYDEPRHPRVTVISNSDGLGKRVELNDGPSLKEIAASDRTKLPLAMGHIDRVADRYGATIEFPPLPLLLKYDSLNVYVDSRTIARLKPPRLDQPLRIALSHIDLKFKPFVFDKETFPPCDFADTRLAHEILGNYRFQRTFYDADHHLVDKPTKPGRYGAVVQIEPQSGAKLAPRLLTLYKVKEGEHLPMEAFDLRVSLPPWVGVDQGVVEEQHSILSRHAREWFAYANEPEAALLLAALAESKRGDPILAGRNSVWARDQRWWYPLKQSFDLAQYKYLIDLPTVSPNYKDKYYPLVLFLHGSGESGEILEQVRTHGPPKLAAHGKHFPFILVSPQCPAGEWWSAPQLRDLLDEVMAKYPVNPDRICVTGLSMGAYGTWELAAEFPDRFAAIVPICGAGSPQDAPRLKNIPAWIFHGEQDPVVPFQRSVEMAEALKKAGGVVKFTPDPKAGHDSWTAAYNDPELYEWLLQQKRSP
jgi:pimeloyl-ACP methyl ester carboxylesterase